VLTWLLLMTLWLPAGNFRKSYRDLVSPIRPILSANPGCATGFGLDVAQRALLAYYGNAQFNRLPNLSGDEPMPTDESCRWLLVSDRESNPHDIGSIGGRHGPAGAEAAREWELVWSGQRRVNRGERLFLYARAAMK
jgi:hypothetical protein